MNFSDWITQKFVEWRGKRIGNSASVKEFAKLFGASQQLMSDWMKPSERGGKAPRSAKYINALAAVYGDEVYSVLGLVKPDEEIISLDQLAPEDREALEAAMSEIGTFDGDVGRVIKILEAHGIRIKAIR